MNNKERPIIFSGDMVKAIMDGQKTMTRRVVKPQPLWEEEPGKNQNGEWCGRYQTMVLDPRTGEGIGDAEVDVHKCPFGVPGDRLWVRETWRRAYPETKYSPGIIYRADKQKSLGMDEYSDRHKWKPSIHMPRWASRINLEVVNVSVERLQDISEEDAEREGAPIKSGWLPDDSIYGTSRRKGFAWFWNSIHSPDTWNKNPWVWVITFKKGATRMDI